MHRLYASAVDAMGNTPLIELARFGRGARGRILLKLEYLNPGASKKDRIARQMIEDAEADGRLSPGQTVVELTSGNTGTGLAIVCAVKGHPFVAVMSAGNSVERRRMMRALGAEVVVAPQAAGSTPGQVSGEDLALVERETARIVTERAAFRADQFNLESNVRAHYLGTGPELWSQAEGRIDAFCDFVGSGGTFAGVSAALKERRERVRCFVVEPAGAAVLSGEAVKEASHRIQGGGYSMSDLPLLRRELVDGYVTVTDREAIETCRAVARQEGVFMGFSGGANVAAALKVMRDHMPGATVAVLACDSGMKYLSTDLWED